MVVETEMQTQEELQGNHLRKQLAACVRSIQWSYAIFWSMSTRQQGLLEWNDGYYNGDIKTRKTTQPTECKADQMVLHRSEQLRELYESLSADDSNQQNRRPSASLSPEDLTDAEWYYLICMSFTFMLGQDLPGKVYKHNEPIWLNNAQLADNKSFGRSLLAKSASIQTVVCFPFMDGVLELGTTDLVLDDPGFVQNITSSFWELQVPICSEHSTSSPPLVGKEEENTCTVLVQEVEDAMMLENHALMIDNDSHAFPFAINSYSPNKETDLIHDNVTEHPPSLYDEIIGTPEDISNVCDDPSGIKRLKESSQVHRGHLIDDEFSNSLHNSLNSRECLSWSFAQNILSSPKGERIKNNMLDHLQEDNHAKPSSLAVESDGSHYDSTLSTVLGNLKQQISPAVFSVQNGSNASNFKVWRSGSKTTKIFTKVSQRMLKKILIDNWVNGDRLVKPQEEHVSRNKAWKSETDDTNANHVLSERRRREKLNEKFHILRSLVPSISKVDKASILADTIEYLKELERRVEELESCREEADPDTRENRKHPDIAERTCDNYGNNELINCQKSSTNKRKASDLDEAEAEHHRLSSRNGAMDMNITRNGAMDMNITIIEKEVLVEMQCPWRDFLLLDIIEAMSNLHLDAHSVQSSTVDGTLAITLRAKLIGTVVASPGMIKRALQRVVSKY